MICKLCFACPGHFQYISRYEVYNLLAVLIQYFPFSIVLFSVTDRKKQKIKFDHSEMPLLSSLLVNQNIKRKKRKIRNQLKRNKQHLE